MNRDMPDLVSGLEEILLMGPGPSCVPGPVYEALGAKTVGHLDPQFLKIMDELKVMLQELMGTSNRMTIPISGTGSAGMEAAFVNTVEKGDKVLVLINGVFGKRMQDVAGRLGGEVEAMEFEWGTPVVADTVAKIIKEGNWKIVAVVHAETSTGVRNPVAEIGRMVRETGALYLVDTVTSLGGIPVAVDEWGADIVYSGTQKCLSCPPGLAPLSLSENAWKAVEARKSKVPNWYLDLTMIANYWGKERVYHHTAPINMLYGLYRALRVIRDEGAGAVFRRHQEAHKLLVAGLEGMGLKMLVDAEWRLPMLNTVRCPEGVDEADIRRRLRSEYKIEIGGGLGPLAGKIWRIGLMGHTARPENVDRFLGSLKKLLG